jgi:pyruvate/2-oxoglutarate dehydrogenase complex dihydrolipoamide dehydrogenase (E3) component
MTPYRDMLAPRCTPPGTRGRRVVEVGDLNDLTLNQERESCVEGLYDVIVVGNGSAGDNIARTLGRIGKRVAVVEASHLGGECLNDGCVPSKALIDISKRATRDGMSWDQVVEAIGAIQSTVRGSDPDGGMAADGIDLFWGEATFEASTVVRIGDQVLRARDVVVATGTAPSLPPIPGLADAAPLTNRSVFKLRERPRRLAVIGGGPIGLELGQSFRRLGSEVTVFEALDRILSTEDADVSNEMTRLLEEQGMQINTAAEIKRIERVDGVVTVTTASGARAFDDILVAAGRRPQIPAGLADLGLRLNQRGYVEINGCGRTNLPGLWAAGDVTGKFQFTHYAGYQAHHIARHIVEGTCAPLPDSLVPWAIFTDPEIGHAGVTEEQARNLSVDIRIAELRASELDWFRTTSQLDGFAKVLAEASTGRLVGAHFICARASTIVGEAALAIQHKLTVRDVASTIHPYPTASELFRWACAKLVE